MSMTLLDIVQDIHNDLDLDEINSIDDTIEAAQVAQIVKTTYFAMMSDRNWPHLRASLNLTPYSDSDLPTHMRILDDMKELCFLNYDRRTTSDGKSNYSTMKWLEPDAFLRKANALNTDNDNVTTVTDPSGIKLAITTNKAPEYFTSFDDRTLVFDSYNSALDSTLQASKCQAMAYIMPTWRHIDTAVPDLPEEAFISLLEEAKSKAAIKLKQAADQKAEQESVRQRQWLSRKARRMNGGIQYPNYGRGRGKTRRDVTFEQGRTV